MATSKKVSTSRVYGQSLVGSKIKVWWPLDRHYYKGAVDSYDSSRKKHRVLYNDGDVEELDMTNERWEFLAKDDSQPDEISLHDEYDNETSDGSPEPKKAKRNEKSSELGRAGDNDDNVPDDEDNVSEADVVPDDEYNVSDADDVPDVEDNVFEADDVHDGEDKSDDDSKPIVSLLKKSPEVMEALKKELKGKKEKEESGEGSSGNETEAVEEESS